MATSKFRCNDEEFEDYDGECKKEKAVENIKESNECKCSWCSPVLGAKDTINNLSEANFESCTYLNINGLLKMFEEAQKMQQKFETFSAEIGKMKKRNAEMMEEVANIKSETKKRMKKHKTEINKEILGLKSEIQIEMELKCGENRVGVLSTVSKKVNALEEKMREMSVAQDTKLNFENITF